METAKLAKLTIKAPERLYWLCSGVFIINVEQISYITLVFPLLNFNDYMSA